MQVSLLISHPHRFAQWSAQCVPHYSEFFLSGPGLVTSSALLSAFEFVSGKMPGSSFSCHQIIPLALLHSGPSQQSPIQMCHLHLIHRAACSLQQDSSSLHLSHSHIPCPPSAGYQFTPWVAVAYWLVCFPLSFSVHCSLQSLNYKLIFLIDLGHAMYLEVKQKCHFYSTEKIL